LVAVKIDLSKFVKNQEALLKIANPEYLLRPVCLEIVSVMKSRIHTNGVAADGSQIGQYSKEYMKVRTGDFQNSKRTKKGELKDAGKFTKVKVENVFLKGDFGNRPSYHRTSDTTIIVSLTRQLENDWAVKPTLKGYGIDFNNTFNHQKMRWVEERKNKEIASLTSSESQYVTDRILELVQDAFNESK
jgi:hypothetical protein